MRRITIVALFVLSLTTFAQNSTPPIEGFGHFKFGMTKKQGQNAIKKHKTRNTKVLKLDTQIEVENIELDGVVFDRTILSFEKLLWFGSFEKEYTYWDDAEKDFNHLLRIMQIRYGDTFVKDGAATWNDAKYNLILLKVETNNYVPKLSIVYVSNL
ncbi:hypothetical protein [Dysgonomonas mossii]|uniref:hypothetical protein n=1 Tax=Dysgonomonas mossii TaxID=163665 RepID=UPI003994AF3D